MKKTIATFALVAATFGVPLRAEATSGYCTAFVKEGGLRSAQVKVIETSWDLMTAAVNNDNYDLAILACEEGLSVSEKMLRGTKLPDYRDFATLGAGVFSTCLSALEYGSDSAGIAKLKRALDLQSRVLLKNAKTCAYPAKPATKKR
jgi:hypothetical protein